MSSQSGTTAVLPLAAHYQLSVEAPARVETGQRVAAGMPLGCAGAPVHAPVCGTVSRIEVRRDQRCDLTISTDAEATAACEDDQGCSDHRYRLPPLVPGNLTLEQFLRRLHEAGVVGLGGGAFPSAEKLCNALRSDTGVVAVVANAVACEAGIDADAAVLVDGLPLALEALEILARLSGVSPVLALGAALEPFSAAVAAAIDARPIEVQLQRIPAEPAAGAETLLLERLFGWRASDDRRPSDDGYLTFNLTTLHAMGAAVLHGEPLLRRPITLPEGNRWVRIGHPLAALGVEGPLRSGGHLSGAPIERDGAVSKGTLAIHPQPAASVAEPCISCAQCQPACPVGLDPEALHRSVLRARGSARAASLPELARCIECGYCNPACPSDIDLLADFREGRRLLREACSEAAAAERAQQRFEAHQTRAARQAAQAEQRREERLQQRTRRSRRWQKR